MNLSSELISEFAKLSKNNSNSNSETTLGGEIRIQNGITYVQLDGNEETGTLTPVHTTAAVKNGERVMVLIKNHTATVIGNMSAPSASSTDVEEMGTKISDFDIVIADKVSTKDFQSQVGRIDTLFADNVIINETVTANTALVNTIKAENADIRGRLTATEGRIDVLEAGQLGADSGYIKELKSDIAEINTLIFGSATGDVIHSSFANAVIAQLGNAQIKSAMIENVSADKITAGDIITNNVRVMSEDGKLIISDETIQISDNNRVRVQIGKDAKNDYSINIWDAYGNLMFSEGGITDSAIKSAIIRNDMVSDTANIAAHKLDIDSLFEEINSSTKTIKSSKIYLDDENQSLDISFKAMSSNVEELQNGVESQGTQISVMQGQIANKIWQQDIDDVTGEMDTKYSELKQDVDGLSVSVGDAAKTATDFMSYTENGLEIGDKTSGSWSGFRTQVTSAAFNVLDSAGIVLASYGAKIIELGKNATNAIIKLCGGKGQIEYDSDDNFLQVTGENLRLKGSSNASLYTTYYDGSHTAEKSAVNSSPQGVYIYSEQSIDIDPDTMSGNWTNSEISLTPSGLSTLADNMYLTSRYGTAIESVSGNISLTPLKGVNVNGSLFLGSTSEKKTSYNDGIPGWYIGADGTMHMTRESGGYIGFHYGRSKDTTSYIKEVSSGVLNINGFDYATNKILWEGAFYMQESHTIALKEAVSKQANGIVLVFSAYTNSTVHNYHWSTHFVPKAMISRFGGGGQTFFMGGDGSFNIFASKYLYIYDTTIKGHDNNKATGTGACGIKYNNNQYLLRYVIGV